MRQAGCAVVGVVLFAAAAAWAEPVGESEARKFLFTDRVADLALVRDSGLRPEQITVIEAILKQMQTETGVNYYGAVAVSPSFFAMMAGDPAQAVMSGLLQIAGQYHSVEAAARSALTACEAARGRGQDRCVLAAQVLPRKYSARPLQLSVDATTAFKSYRKGRGPKAMAISPATPAFAIARGQAAPTAALTECNRRTSLGGQGDCEIVIED